MIPLCSDNIGYFQKKKTMIQSALNNRWFYMIYTACSQYLRTCFGPPRLGGVRILVAYDNTGYFRQRRLFQIMQAISNNTG